VRKVERAKAAKTAKRSISAKAKPKRKPANRSKPVELPAILDDPALRGARVVSPKEAAAILGCGKTRMAELIAQGLVRSYLDGTKRKVFVDSLISYQQTLASQTSGAKR
jgi:hypothetical protein